MRHIAAGEFAKRPATERLFFCGELPCCSAVAGWHRGEHFREWDGTEPGGVIGYAIWDDQHAVVEESPTCINAVGHIAFPFVLVRLEQGLAKAADHLSGIVAIQQKRADAVLPHGADTMAEHQPASVGLDRGPAIPKLDQFPRKRRLEEHLALIPEVDVGGEHHVDILLVLASQPYLPPPHF